MICYLWNDFCLVIVFGVLLQCWTLSIWLWGALLMHQTLSPQMRSNTSSSFWMRIEKTSCERLNWSTSTLGAKLCKMNFTCRQEKLTQLCLCKLPLDPRGRSLALNWWIQKPLHLLSEVSLIDMKNSERIYQLQQPFVKDHQTSSPFAITIHPYRNVYLLLCLH